MAVGPHTSLELLPFKLCLREREKVCHTVFSYSSSTEIFRCVSYQMFYQVGGTPSLLSIL